MGRDNSALRVSAPHKDETPVGPSERLTVASAAMLSLDPDSRDTLIRAAERGRKADTVFRRAWPAAGRDRHG